MNLRVVFTIVGPKLRLKLILLLFTLHLGVKVVTDYRDSPPFPIKWLDVPPVNRVFRFRL